MAFFSTDKKDDKKKDNSGLFALGLDKGMHDAEETKHRQAEKAEQEVEKKEAKVVHNEAVKHDLEKSKQAEKDRADERDKRLGATKTD